LASKYKKWENVKVLSVEEVINRVGKLDRLNLNTSAGYPHVLHGRSKKTFMEVNEATGIVTFKSDDEAARVQEYIDSWRQHIHQEIWIMSLKDELLKPGKLARVFEIASMEYTIACRAYFGSWIDMMHSTVGNHFSCVGMNPESFEWSEMTYKLLANSDYGIDMDAPNWDKNLMGTFLFWACESVNAWYQKNDNKWTPADDEARLHLITQLVHSYIMAGWLLFRKLKGMPSGHVLTALFNTICNMIMHLIWFLVNVPEQYRDVSFYDSIVQTVLYGDDALDSIKVDYLKYLNRQSVIATYGRYCLMTITSARKDGKLDPYNKVVDMSFLKRGFRHEGLFFKPLLAQRSMISMLCFVRKSKHVAPEEQLVCNMKTFASFAYFYGPEYYNRTMAYLGKLYPSLILPDYQYYNNLYMFGKYEVSYF